MKAVFYACRAMHASLSGKADGQQNSFCHCERASGHLWSSLNVSGTTSDPSLNHVSGTPGGFSVVLQTLPLQACLAVGLSKAQKPE